LNQNLKKEEEESKGGVGLVVGVSGELVPPETALSPTWQPDEELRAYATSKGVDWAAACNRFVAWYANRGERHRYWGPKWKAWVDKDANDAKKAATAAVLHRGAPRPSSQYGGGPAAAAARLIAKAKEGQGHV
jgi:hypothetical protein